MKGKKYINFLNAATRGIKLPFSVSFPQMTWFVAILLVVMLLGDKPPLIFVDNVLLKYLCIPTGMAWFMTKKIINGKNVYEFLYSVCAFTLRPKMTYAGKTVKLKKKKIKRLRR